VSKQMSDVYNSIFTETAPFLAELMEGLYKVLLLQFSFHFNYL
jgi:hypothetical protein